MAKPPSKAVKSSGIGPIPRKNPKRGEIPFGKGKGIERKNDIRLSKSAEAVEALEEEARQTVMFVSAEIVRICRENKLKPGWAMLGVCEFLALMVHQNMPPENYGEETTRFTNYIVDRLKEFNTHEITH